MVKIKIFEGLNNAFRKLRGLPIVDKKAVEELILDLQRMFLKADVNIELVNALSERIRHRTMKEHKPPVISLGDYTTKVVYEELTNFIGKQSYPVNIEQEKPNVILLIGIQGSGKTTSAAKLGYFFKKKKFKTALVCADTYRPGAYDQLSQLAEKIEVPLYGEPESKDSVAIAKKGVKHFIADKMQVIIVDSAGRHKDEKDLMKEMVKIERAIKPFEIILVIDGTIGQQAASQAHAFNQATQIGSIFVTKLDGSAKGGGALSAVATTGAPIKFIGIGERVDDLEKFDPKSFIGRIIGIPDLNMILEKVKEAEIPMSRDLQTKFLSGRFNLRDMYEQMKSVRKMGPLGKLLQMMGVGSKLPDGFQDIAEDKLNQWKFIMDSMTAAEMEDPKIINSSRMNRIARGSGTNSRDVKELVKQYNMVKKMVKKFGKSRGFRKGMPGGFPKGGGPPGFPGGKVPGLKKFKFK
ncbi:MAG: signal recognition particle protein [Candidatus Helarchaeota archaeon]|nr:signal recognition particle protein [Candidatus Helarchaeota archaeon]